MKDLHQAILQDEPELDAKFLYHFLKKFKKPDIQPSMVFRDKMKRKINKKIQEKKEAQEHLLLTTIPSFAKWRFRLTGFVTAVCVFLFLFILSFFSDFFSNQLFIPHKYVKVEHLDSRKPNVEQHSKGTKAVTNEMMEQITVLSNRTTEVEETYLYDGKKYPKVAEEMSIYKHSWALVNEGLLTKYGKNLKFGDISLKDITDMEISSLILRNPEEYNHMIDIDLQLGTMDILDFPLASLSLDDSKNVIKQIEKVVKKRGISLTTYGVPERKEEGVIFYPFLLQEKYRIRDTRGNQPQGIWITYDTDKSTLSIYGIDIAKYTYANYPTLPKEEILKEFTLGMTKLNAPEVVYLLKTSEANERFYIPWLRFVIDEERVIYKELI